jgi:predicted unusual protein kinase regulating ubiquinone biosynthesis (AarF/ABC1/UbiB family)
MARERERDSLAGRLTRYAKVSASIGGVAARAASSRLIGGKGGAVAAELKRALGGLKGPVMKVAQMLATIPEALPAEFARELTELQANAPPMGWAFVQRRMSSELGPAWNAQFAAFDKTSAAAASLGQVHRAVSLEGRQLACKLQYPDMAAAVEADVAQLGVFLAIYRRFDRSIDTRNVLTDIGARLREELDYELEARHMRLYADLLSEEARVHVPRVLPEVSTKRLLTMTWLEGRPLAAFEDAPEAVRNQVAAALFRAWYVPFYQAGVIHGDPHLGNYTVAEDHSVNLLDFGCIRAFPAAFIQGVIDLYRSVRDDDYDLALHAFTIWGFENLTPPVVDVLRVWADFLYAPLLEDRPRRLQEAERRGEVFGQDVAFAVHKRLKAEGGVTPPREWVFMNRASVGLGAVFLRLRAKLNWHRMFHELIEDFDTRALARRQKAAFTRAGVPLP